MAWAPWLYGCAMLFLLGSCSVTEHLGPNQYLLKSDPTFSRASVALKDSLRPKGFEKLSLSNLKSLGASTVDSYTLYSSVRTRENSRMLLPKTYLHLFMLGKSMQIPLDSLAPPTYGGKTLNGTWSNDLKVLGQSPSKALATLKYLEDRIIPGRNFIDSTGSFLQRTAGEPPVVIDTTQIRQDLENLQTVYFSEGFFYATASYEIDTCSWRVNRQKAKVKFLIQEGKAAVIDSYAVEKKGIPPKMYHILVAGLEESRIVPGELYKEDKVSAERSRIVGLMRNNGYYTFNPQLVSFVVDTMPDSNLVSGVVPKNYAIRGNFSPVYVKLVVDPGAVEYTIRNVTLAVDPAEEDPAVDTLYERLVPAYMNDSLREAWGVKRRLYSDSNKVEFQGYARVMNKLNWNFLEELIVEELGESYSLAKERQTLKRLQSLGIFKYVLVKHTLNGDSVDVRIETQLLKKYSFKGGVEGFSENSPWVSQNLPGVGLELSLRDLMVFKGAERLDFSAAGSASFFRPGPNEDLSVALEGSGSFSFTVPRFMVPFVGKIVRNNLQKYNPITSFTFKAVREDNRFTTIVQEDTVRRIQSGYSRNSLTLDWNYSWDHILRPNSKKTLKSSVSPYVVTFVTSNLSDDFLNRLRGIDDSEFRNFLVLDFAQRFSSWGRYQLNFSNYLSSKVNPTFYFQPTFEIGGNTPFLIDRLMHLGAGLDVLDDEVRIFGSQDFNAKDSKLGNVLYGQYLKLSAEGRFNIPLSPKSSLVARGFIGVAQPWNFAPNVPLPSRFFSGGTNGMRGWQSNTLGPGTFSPDISDSTAALLGNFLTVGGEFQVEFNAELRANVYKFIELAIFSDIGNVWFLPTSDVDFVGGENAKLSKNNYLELGWDAGLGVRLDFDFFIFRVDLAQQLYAPDLQDFVVKSFPRDLGHNRFQINFGIGYPF